MLASRGDIVINGGYGGIMEAVSIGANEANGIVVGITLAQKPAGNSYLTKTVVVENFFIRLQKLMEADAFIFFPGGSGTAVEILTAIHIQGIQSKLGMSLSKFKPIIVICEDDKKWDDFVKALNNLGCSEKQIAVIKRVKNEQRVADYF